MPASVWKGFVSFGLVSFPVRLFAAARAEAIHFHLLHKKDLSRVKEVWYCAKEEKRIERADMVKGYEVSKGEYVVVEDGELKKIEPVTASTMDVIQFVKRDEVDPIYLERSYYVGADGTVNKPYRLFTQALHETKYDALAKLTMHGREHIVLIRAAGEGLILHTLFYPSELQKGNRYRDAGKVDRKELELAKTLIQQLAAPFAPESFKDEYFNNVQKLLKQKQSGEKISVVERPRKAPVIDLMDALKQSLQAQKTAVKRKPKRKVA